MRLAWWGWGGFYTWFSTQHYFMTSILESVVCLWLMPENFLRMPLCWKWTDFECPRKIILDNQSLPGFQSILLCGQWKLLHLHALTGWVQDRFHDDFCDDDVVHDAQHGPLWVWEPGTGCKNHHRFSQWSFNATLSVLGTKIEGSFPWYKMHFCLGFPHDNVFFALVRW